jgi:1-acyl-sn-glycerol-3-phosphate acyltransferase
MYYKENLGYEYPARSDEHMLKVKHLVDTNFDEKFPYLDKSLWFKIKRVLLWIGLQLIAFPVCCNLIHGLKIHGKENLKKHKKLLKNGAITICNHVFMLDYLCVLKCIRPHLQFHPGWKTNFEGSNRGFIRLIGGIPVPTDNMRAMVKFKKAIDEVLDSGKWLHFFPEGSLWFYYPDIRPLKPAVFRFAVDSDKPIIPLTISFRKRRGLYRIWKRKPCATIHIGEPLLVNKEISKGEAVIDLQKRAYHIMQVMNGINPGDPTYNEDLNIDNYKSTI